jgi:hypothetical protein
MFGHQSVLLAGPSHPLSAWLVSVHSTYFCAFAMSAWSWSR